MLPDAFVPPASFIQLGPADGLLLDIRYASTRNFVGRNVYGPFDSLFLHEIAAGKLLDAVVILRERRPDLRLLVFDGLRPNRVQRLFWDMVLGTPMQPYVGNPAVGSVHGYGFAVDLSLADQDGRELDMGTPFDDFTPLSEPIREEGYLASGDLSADQVTNRRALRDVMVAAGFLPLPIEWWHFDALPGETVRRTYTIVE